MKPIPVLGSFALLLSLAACNSTLSSRATEVSEPTATETNGAAQVAETNGASSGEKRSTKPEVRYYVISDA